MHQLHLDEDALTPTPLRSGRLVLDKKGKLIYNTIELLN